MTRLPNTAEASKNAMMSDERPKSLKRVVEQSHTPYALIHVAKKNVQLHSAEHTVFHGKLDTLLVPKAIRDASERPRGYLGSKLRVMFYHLFQTSPV